MITPLTITSLSQGVLRDAPKSDSDYWDRPADLPQAEDLPFWHALKLEWPNSTSSRKT